MFLWISAAETIHAGYFLEGPLISWFWYVLIHFDSMPQVATSHPWSAETSAARQFKRPSACARLRVCACDACDACDACEAEVSWRVMPKNYQPPNLHGLPRNMAHLYIYIYLESIIYTYDLPLISLLKMGLHIANCSGLVSRISIGMLLRLWQGNRKSCRMKLKRSHWDQIVLSSNGIDLIIEYHWLFLGSPFFGKRCSSFYHFGVSPSFCLGWSAMTNWDWDWDEPRSQGGLSLRTWSHCLVARRGRSRAEDWARVARVARVAPGPNIKGLWSHRNCQQPSRQSTTNRPPGANPMRIRPDPSRLLGLSFGMAKRSIKAQRCNRRDPIPWAAVEWLLSTQHSRCLDGCCRSVSSKVAGNNAPRFFFLGWESDFGWFWRFWMILVDFGGMPYFGQIHFVWTLQRLTANPNSS